MGWSEDPANIPTPRELFRRLDAGLLSREDFQSAMAVHARELIAEMEDVHRSPLQAYLDEISNRAAAVGLTLRHGEAKVREALSALASIEDFVMARFLWNAEHLHIPLHCLLRNRREPLLKIFKLESSAQWLAVEVEYGKAAAALTTREAFSFRRNRRGELQLETRKVIRRS
jgi:hypothetical protein